MCFGYKCVSVYECDGALDNSHVIDLYVSIFWHLFASSQRNPKKRNEIKNARPPPRAAVILSDKKFSYLLLRVIPYKRTYYYNYRTADYNNSAGGEHYRMYICIYRIKVQCA